MMSMLRRKGRGGGGLEASCMGSQPAHRVVVKKNTTTEDTYNNIARNFGHRPITLARN